jgi:hypothetical protein
LYAHIKRKRCKFLKAPPLIDEKMAATAKAQFIALGGGSRRNKEERKLEEIAESFPGFDISERKEENHPKDFEIVHVKEEPMDFDNEPPFGFFSNSVKDEPVNDYEIEPLKPENKLNMKPVVILNRLESHEVKEETNEWFEDTINTESYFKDQSNFESEPEKLFEIPKKRKIVRKTATKKVKTKLKKVKSNSKLIEARIETYQQETNAVKEGSNEMEANLSHDESENEIDLFKDPVFEPGKKEKKQTLKKFLYQRHKPLFSPTGDLTCDICGKKFARYVMIIHMKIHKKFADVFCEYENCQSRFKDQANLRKHIKIKHAEFNQSMCFICGKSFPTNAILNRHLPKHEDPKAECKICGKMVRHLRTHTRTVHEKKDEPKLTCPICGKPFVKYAIENHIKAVHEKTFQGKTYHCDECSESFTRREDLRK